MASPSRALAALSIQPRLGVGRPSIRFAAGPVGRRPMVVRAGGPPSTNVLILAFVLPLSLFVGTLVAAARVADDLDERFLREVCIHDAALSPKQVLNKPRALLHLFGPSSSNRLQTRLIISNDPLPILACGII